MLMGICEVSKEGEFTLQGDPRVLYSVMMYTRMVLVKNCSTFTAPSVLIATRYCALRRQFSTQQGSKEERKVIDYQTTAFAVAKLISRVVCQ